MKAVPSSLVIPNGTIEAIKWLALGIMTLDHINKYLFAEKYIGVFDLGRLAMPLFGFVLAYNLARRGGLERGIYNRTMKRLCVYGLVATPVFFCLVGWWPLNILFMLLVAAGIAFLVEKGGMGHKAAAVLLFLVGGLFVEFWWFALMFCFFAWRYCKSPTLGALFGMVASAASLYVVNRNYWAMAALPLIFAAPHIDLRMPRLRHVFYIYYPAHLAVILAVSLALK